jgi:hypothetical protein
MRRGGCTRCAPSPCAALVELFLRAMRDGRVAELRTWLLALGRY